MAVAQFQLVGLAAVSDLCVTESATAALALQGFCLRAFPMLISAIAERAVGRANVALLRDALLDNWRTDEHLLTLQKMLFRGIIFNQQPQLDAAGYVIVPAKYGMYDSWKALKKVCCLFA